MIKDLAFKTNPDNLKGLTETLKFIRLINNLISFQAELYKYFNKHGYDGKLDNYNLSTLNEIDNIKK